MSGQYITQGDNGSVEMFWTLPPTENARPDGVRRWCTGDGDLAADRGCGTEGEWAWGNGDAWTKFGYVGECIGVTGDCAKEPELIGLGGATKRGDEGRRLGCMEALGDW